MGFNILVVDDSSVMRAMIIKTLHLSGLSISEVHEAANGQEALKFLSDHWIDLALVDINMPVMGGEEMIDQLRQNPELQNLPIIVVSTESSERRISTLREKGVGFIHKPFVPEQLRELIIQMTGASHEQNTEEGPVHGGGTDF